MIRLFLLLVAAALVFGGCASRKDSDRPGLLARSVRLFTFGKNRDRPDSAITRVKDLEVAMHVEPLPVRLSDDRRIKLRLSLKNRSRRFVHLEFPTTQRIEILMRDRAGKIVSQWSEERAFAKQPGYVAINPGERIEYSTSVPTRDMAAGTPYIIEAFFPDFNRLKVQKTVIPEP